MKTKFEIEYPLQTSTKVLYKRLSSAIGLTEWFADDVNQQGEIFTFTWDNNQQDAQLLDKKDKRYVAYKWVDDEDEDSYFSFLLNTDEVTNSLSLIITDFAEENEVDEAIELWNKQIDGLKRKLGI